MVVVSVMSEVLYKVFTGWQLHSMADGIVTLLGTAFLREW